MHEDAGDDRRVGDDGHDAHRRGTPRAREGVDLVDAPQQLLPAVAGGPQASTSTAKRVHPQQIAHAVIAASRWAGDLTARYGTACARRIRKLAAAYTAALDELNTAAKAA